jgi:hypothetical protein
MRLSQEKIKIGKIQAREQPEKKKKQQLYATQSKFCSCCCIKGAKNACNKLEISSDCIVSTKNQGIST